MSDTFTIRLLRFLPKNLISRVFGWIARRRRPRILVRPFMRWFAERFRLDLTEAEHDFEDYDSLLDLFTRRLKEGARQIDQTDHVLISPVDAAVGAFGRVDNGRLVQAKGLDYALEALLGDAEEARRFQGGSYITLYLSPRDYHRIHAPRAGRVTRTLYEPGTLWPVNQAAVRTVPSLFAVNERVTSFVETDRGPIAVCMVGATNVGSIALAYDPLISNQGGPRQDIHHDAEPVSVERGGDLGIFQLGSTVVLVIADPAFRLDDLESGQSVRLGRSIGRFD